MALRDSLVDYNHELDASPAAHRFVFHFCFDHTASSQNNWGSNQLEEALLEAAQHPPALGLLAVFALDSEKSVLDPKTFRA